MTWFNFNNFLILVKKIGLLVTNYIIQSYSFLILNQKIKIVLPQSYIFSIKKIILSYLLLQQSRMKGNIKLIYLAHVWRAVTATMGRCVEIMVGEDP